MRRVPVAFVLSVLLFTAVCKKKVAVNDAVKADLKNYLGVELPKSGKLFAQLRSLHEASEASKEGESEEQKTWEKDSKLKVKAIQESVEHLKKIQLATNDVRGIHGELIKAIEKIEGSFNTIAGLEKAEGLSAVTDMFSAMKGVVDGIRFVSTWNEDSESACKLNGLESEYQTFKDKYWLKT